MPSRRREHAADAVAQRGVFGPQLRRASGWRTWRATSRSTSAARGERAATSRRTRRWRVDARCAEFHQPVSRFRFCDNNRRRRRGWRGSVCPPIPSRRSRAAPTTSASRRWASSRRSSTRRLPTMRWAATPPLQLPPLPARADRDQSRPRAADARSARAAEAAAQAREFVGVRSEPKIALAAGVADDPRHRHQRAARQPRRRACPGGLPGWAAPLPRLKGGGSAWGGAAGAERAAAAE